MRKIIGRRRAQAGFERHQSSHLTANGVLDEAIGRLTSEDQTRGGTRLKIRSKLQRIAHRHIDPLRIVAKALADDLAGMKAHTQF